jgi:hypothetical protein
MSNDFRFYASFNKVQLSIGEIAYRLGHSFKMFSEYDERFKNICIHLPKENFKINLFDTNSLDDLAEVIIKYNLKDIRKYDKLVTPTLDYKREFGFSLGFNFESKSGENIFSLHTLIGGTYAALNYKMNETPIKQIEKFNSLWYSLFIKSLVKYLPIQNAVIRPRDMMFLERVIKKYKYPIGLVNYFSSDLQDLIPKEIDGMKYEKLEHGVITFISEEIFENEKGLNFLCEIMDGIGKSNPQFLI